MGYQVKVGPRVIQLNQGNTVMVSGKDGQIGSNGHFGLFCEDTRFLSNYQFTVNRTPFVLITASPINHYTGLFYLTNPSITSPEGEIPEQTVLLQVTRMVGGGVHDDFDLISYASRPVHLYFEITVKSDFLDIFDVKADRLIRRGTINTIWDQKGQALNFTYENKDFKRKFLYQLGRADETPFLQTVESLSPLFLFPAGAGIPAPTLFR